MGEGFDHATSFAHEGLALTMWEDANLPCTQPPGCTSSAAHSGVTFSSSAMQPAAVASCSQETKPARPLLRGEGQSGGGGRWASMWRKTRNGGYADFAAVRFSLNATRPNRGVGEKRPPLGGGSGAARARHGHLVRMQGNHSGPRAASWLEKSPGLPTPHRIDHQLHILRVGVDQLNHSGLTLTI